MKLVDEISPKELEHLISAGDILPEITSRDGWEHRDNVLYHRESGVIVVTFDQCEPCAYADNDDIGASILRECGLVD